MSEVLDSFSNDESPSGDSSMTYDIVLLFNGEYDYCLMPVNERSYLIKNLNNFIFPFNGGYLNAGSNQLGVCITGFERVKVLKVCFP